MKEAHLGKTIAELQPSFRQLFTQFEFNVCGEGGEYETAVFDCPLFKQKRISIIQSTNTRLSGDDMAPVCTMHLQELCLEPKSAEDIARHEQIIASRKAAVFADSEEVKHEEYEFVAKPPRAIT